eukprot:scaffold26218_cov46-Skeletonema_menzelii.AAC.1
MNAVDGGLFNNFCGRNGNGFAKAVAIGSATNKAKKIFPDQRWQLRLLEGFIIMMLPIATKY